MYSCYEEGVNVYIFLHIAISISGLKLILEHSMVVDKQKSSPGKFTWPSWKRNKSIRFVKGCLEFNFQLCIISLSWKGHKVMFCSDQSRDICRTSPISMLKSSCKNSKWLSFLHLEFGNSLINSFTCISTSNLSTSSLFSLNESSILLWQSSFYVADTIEIKRTVRYRHNRCPL